MVVRTESLRIPNWHDTGSTSPRSVSEVALIWDTISHYSPVLIAPLAFIAPARPEKNKRSGPFSKRPLRSSRWLRPTRRFRRSSATPSGRRSWRRRGERWKPPRTSALTRACRQPAPGAVVPGLGNGMMLRGDVAEWVAEKDRELQRAQTQLQESTLLWAKVAAWVGVAGTVVAIIIAVLGR